MGIKLLKEGEIGWGLMVENEGSISTTFHKNVALLSEQKINGKFDLTKPVYVYATLQKYGVENRNGRVYPEAVLKREVERYQDVINRNASFNELDHPAESTISLKGGSPHRVVQMFWEGNTLIGKLEILVSRGYRDSGIISCDGDLAAHYLDYGMTLGISSRAVGSLKKVNGQNIVDDDLELICFDLVTSPSTPGSYLYSDLKDKSAYDEVLPAANDKAKTNKSDSFSGQNDVMNRLNNFLNKSN